MQIRGTDEKATNEGDLTSETHSGTDEPPPYEFIVPPSPLRPSFSAPVSPTLRRNPTRPRPLNVPSSNFLKIKCRNESIKTAYVIDPGLPNFNNSQYSGSRKNLEIEGANGSIWADVWLVDDALENSGSIGAGSAGRELTNAELDLNVQNGSLHVKLDLATTRPVTLNASTRNGSIFVAIPPDFVGLVILGTANGSVSVSRAMESRLMMLSEENKTRTYFAGDIRKAGYGGSQNWPGSVINARSQNGSVKMSFINDSDTNYTSGSRFPTLNFGGW